MSSIFEYLCVGQYMEGWQRYSNQEFSTENEMRWAALCLFNLNRVQEAKDILLAATGRGNRVAAIELATAYRHLGQMALAAEYIEGLQTLVLQPFDQALMLREKGLLLYSRGELRAALGCLERAWAASFNDDLGRYIRPSIGHALAMNHAALGHYQRSIPLFERAIAESNSSVQVHALAGYASSLINIGDFDAARTVLERADAVLPLAPVAGAVVLYVRGLLERSLGHYASASGYLVNASEVARRLGEQETETYAELALAAVRTASGEQQDAGYNLARARRLCSTDLLMSLYKLRQGALLVQHGLFQGIQALEVALEYFIGHDISREAAWTSLHLTEGHLKMGNIALAQKSLQKAHECLHNLDVQYPAQVELRALPHVLQHLKRFPKDHLSYQLYLLSKPKHGQLPLEVELQLLGSTQVLLDGNRVKFGLRRSVELWWYMLERTNQQVTLEQVLTDLFPEDTGERARKYFHQARYDLQRVIPGLRIEYRESLRLYAMSYEGFGFRCDALDLKALLKTPRFEQIWQVVDLYKGSLLPGIDGEWVSEEQRALERSVVSFASKALESQFHRSDFAESRKLAEWLIKLSPTDEATHIFMIRSTYAIEGGVSASKELEKSIKIFESEVGEAPSSIISLKSELRLSA